ncbi:MAG: glycosyltransferase family 9 protein [Gemmatimonadaceae bacterium]
MTPTVPAASPSSGSLIVQTSFLGDVVLTTPLIALLARHGPVDVVTTPVGASVLAGNPDVRRVIPFDKRGLHGGWSGLRALAREVAATDRAQVAFLAQGSWRSSMLTLLAGYRHRVGFNTSAGRLFYTRIVPYRKDRHHAARLWSLGAAEGTSPTAADTRPRLYPSDVERGAVDSLLATSWTAGDPLIALAPGSAWATKRWPYYTDLARRLTTIGRPVVIGSDADREAARAILDATFGAAIDATGRLSLLASAALLGRCVALVTNDSAPQHLASAMGTPTIALFGPTVPGLGSGRWRRDPSHWATSASPAARATPLDPCVVPSSTGGA